MSAAMTTEKIYELYLKHPRIATDTRRIEPGSLFFALKGASFDGNEFALTAVRLGAAYAIVDDRRLIDENPCLCSKLIYVQSVLESLQHLAAYHRRELGVPIIAVTGSNGKTTTKELLCAALSKRYRVTATVGNYNNHLGVPLTLLTMNSLTEIGVVEMGANGQGEIAFLCDIAAPNYGIINNIGRAHLEGFGGEEGIKRGKGELYDYLLSTQGVAFVASDDSVLMEMAKLREGLTTVEYPFALASGLKHQLEGDYNLKNIASTVAIATFMRVEGESIAEAIAEYVPHNNRSQRQQTPLNTLIIDCYNANPSSMEVAIQNFSKHSSSRSKVMILGDMFELGEWSLAEHQRVIERALEVKTAKVILVGSNFEEAYLSLGEESSRVERYPSRSELEASLIHSPLRDSIILIKGSRGVGLEQIVKKL